MKLWLVFVLGTIICWGAYVPTIHHGQLGFGSRNSALRAFLFVGLAYFIVSAGVLAYLLIFKAEPMQLTKAGVSISTFAGLLGACGALCIVFAFKFGGKPIFVAPVVFAGAPIFNTVVSMIWDKPAKAPSPMFYLGNALAAAGAALVLMYKPVSAD